MSAIEQEHATVAPRASSGATTALHARKSARRKPEAFATISYVTVTLFGLFCLVPLWMIVWVR